jgi:SAM-dependent methyltransferase
MTFRLEAKKEVAFDSPDHLCPVGCVNDNFSSVELIDEVIRHFGGRKISVLDLGCAGGQFVVDFIERGHTAIGLEGSSNSLTGSGKNNWDKYHNSNLFLCDITEEYQLYENDAPLKFDYIHSEEVFEHISEDKIDSMLGQIKKHLKEDGICSFGISKIPHEVLIDDQLYILHQSVFPSTWWKNKLIKNEFEILEGGRNDENYFGYIFDDVIRKDCQENSCYFCCKIEKPKQKYNLSELLHNYINEPENAEHNFSLALYYHGIGQTATAVSYYLRAAERTDDDLLKYECLIRGSMCFDSQGTRNFTVKGFLLHALALCPERPEAYYMMSKFYEKENKDGSWNESFTISSIGLKVADLNSPPLRTTVDYPGNYALLFQKANSSWWCGLCEESRDLLLNLLENYQMEESFRQVAINNLKKMNVEVKPFATYNQSKYQKLKIKFEGSQNIKENYSEAYQDMFVLTMLNGKRNGTYLEIGAGNAFYGNNTALLEKDFDWKGVAFDICEEFVSAHNNERKNPCLFKNALTTNYELLLSGMNFPENIDYLQLDCDPPEVTYKILLNIPFEKYKFAVITYEHDYYCDETKLFQEKSRKYLDSYGYVRVVNNISPDDHRPYEDWWVHPDLIDNQILNQMLHVDDTIKKAENYILLL